jgi:hypothetical protein
MRHERYTIGAPTKALPPCQRQGRPPANRSTYGFTILTVKLLVVGLAFVSVVTLAGCRLLTRDFDAAQWKAVGNTCMSNKRLLMVDDLRQDYLRQGMTRGEVRALLGKPNSIWRDRGLWWEWPIGMSFADCLVFSIRFVHGRLVETTKSES